MSKRPIAIGVITNPNSKKNRARVRRRDELQRIVGDHGVVRETRSVREIRPAIEEFLARDVRYWVSDGGDGALHWLVNEVRETLAGEGDRALPILIPTNGGTIDFVAKKAGIRGEADEILERLVRAEERGAPLSTEEIPTFIMSGTRVDEAGREVPFERLGFLTAIAGVGQRFFDEYYKDPLPGRATLLKIIAKGLASIALNAPVLSRLPDVPRGWREFTPERLLWPQEALVRADGKELPAREWRALHVGAFFSDIGGIVKLFPLAGEGKLHLMAGNPSMLDAALGVPNIFLGRPIGHGMLDQAAERVEVEARGKELLNPNIDGEPFRGVKSLAVVPGPRVRIPKIDCYGERE